MRRRELDDAPPSLGRERAPARVLEGRNRVEEARLARAELTLERVRVETFVVHRDRHDVGAQASEDLQRTIVGRRLDEDAAGPGCEELLGIEDEALETTRRHQDPAGIDSVAAGEQLAQRRVASAGAVGEHGRVRLDCGVRAVGEQLGIEALRRGCAPGERDHAATLSAGSAATL